MGKEQYSFSCYGHSNITAMHDKTIEFTKDDFVTKEGDCIIGIKADFQLIKLRKFLNNKEKIEIKISAKGITETINCNVNKDFNSSHEIVVRKSEFNSRRTLGVRADKASSDLGNEFRELLKNDQQVIDVVIIALT